MRQFSNSLRGKLLLALIFSAVAPLTIAITLAVRSSRSTVEQQVGAARADMARQVARWLDRVVYERTIELQAAGAAGEIVASAMGFGDSTATNNSLSAFRKRSSLARGVRIYNAQGQAVASVGEGGSGDAAGADWFKQGMDAKAPTWVGPVQKGSDGSLIVRIADAVPSATGAVGVMVVDLDWKAVSATALGEVEQATGGKAHSLRAYVMDSSGAIVGSTNAADVLSKSVEVSDLRTNVLGGKGGSMISTFLGKAALVGYAPLLPAAGMEGYTGFGNSKAAVLIAEDEAAAFAEAGALRNLLLGIALAVAALVAWGASIVAGRIANPLVAAANLAERLSVGDTRTEIAAMAGTDETARLNGSLLRLLAYLRELTAASERVAAGDMHIDVTPKSDQDELSRAFATVVRVNTDLIRELGEMTKHASEGQLSARAESSKFSGDFREIVEGVNRTLDAIVAPINEAAQVLEKLAQRDLTARVTGEYHGDHARIKLVVNSAAMNLDVALTEVWHTSDFVAGAAGQIGSSSETLASRAGDQASSLEQVSSSLQELASMTRQTASNAQEVRSLAEQARGSAQKGAASMVRLSDAMSKIKASSDATAKIVRTIDELAFQTNLLALNAAVEAARAGDAGRGFAVVAEEVRNLAVRSAEAAKNTAALIEEAVLSADGGVRINVEVTQQLTEINDRVGKVGEVIGEIAEAAVQQSQGVEQINSAIERMNFTTQEVAASSEESASASVELSSQAERLKALVNGFNLTDAKGAVTPALKAVARQATARKEIKARPAARPMAKAIAAKASPFVAKASTVARRAEEVIPFDDADDVTLQEF